MRIIIVGAGIAGLSIARSALDCGHTVTVLEQSQIPHPNSASYDEHRLIRYQYGAAEGYARMVGGAFAAWERLWRDLGARHFADSGVLSISLTKGDYADTSLATLRDAGLPHELLSSAETQRLCPQLDVPARATGLLCHPGGALFADRIVRDLVTHIGDRGAELLAQTEVVAVDDAEATVRTRHGATLKGDLVVVAAGAWLDKLLPAEYAGLPVQRQMLCYIRAPQDHLAYWAEGPALCVLGDNNVYTLPPRDGTGLKFGCGALRQSLGPEHGFEADMDRGRKVIEAFRPFLRREADYQTVRGKVGYYVMDAERRFKLHRRNRRIVITNCDGQMFKFGPLLGERIMAAIDGRQSFEATARWMGGHL
ncbi:MAG: FAD-dependent oxidoreductase [Sphingomonadales bacterium]|nr:FAD-dependent oxidoreductase [Sphingomonadales bacterium]